MCYLDFKWSHEAILLLIEEFCARQNNFNWKNIQKEAMDVNFITNEAAWIHCY